MHAFDKALQQLNRGLAAVGLDQLPSLIQGIPGHPNDCIVQRAFRPVDPSCSVGVDYISFTNKSAARSVADAWGTVNGQDRMAYCSEPGEHPYMVEMPKALRAMIKTFDHLYIFNGIDFSAVAQSNIDAWSEWITDERIESISAAWAAEQERREFVGV